MVTSVGGDIGQSVIQCLLDTEYADHLCGCDLDPYAAGRAYLKKFAVAPAVSDKKAYGDFIIKIIHEQNIKFILPLNEREIAYFIEENERFKALGIKVLILNKDISNVFFDKYETIRFLNAKGFATPTTYLAEDYSGQLRFPMILKSRCACGGKGMVQVKDQEELDFYIKKIPDCIVQEMVGDFHDEYTVGVFSDGKAVHSIAFQRYLGYGSMTKFARLVEDRSLSLLAEKIAKSCELVGPLNIQLRRKPEGFLPFEINPRISSTVYFRDRFGFKDVKWWLDIYHGKTINYFPKFKSGIAVRTVGGVFFDTKESNLQKQ